MADAYPLSAYVDGSGGLIGQRISDRQGLATGLAKLEKTARQSLCQIDLYSPLYINANPNDSIKHLQRCYSKQVASKSTFTFPGGIFTSRISYAPASS